MVRPTQRFSHLPSPRLSQTPPLPRPRGVPLYPVPTPPPEHRAPHDPAQLSQIDLSKEEVDRLIAEVMRYMLFKNYQQFGVPVKREELVQLITKTYKTRNLPNVVIQRAQMKFKNVFGFDMREIIRSRQSKNPRGPNSSQVAAPEVKCYVLKSTIPDELRAKFVDTQESSVAASLALVIVSIIHICGEKVPEETLWLHLGRLGIKQDISHPVFGDIKQCLEAIIKQRYISKEKNSSAEGDSYVYELAEKALDQAVKSKLDAFVSKMVKKDGPGVETPGPF